MKDYDKRLRETMYDLHCCMGELQEMQEAEGVQLGTETVFQVAAQLSLAMSMRRVAELLGDDTTLTSPIG